jgi:hypothetical protein
MFWTAEIAVAVIAVLAGYALIRLRYWMFGHGPWRSPYMAWRDRIDIIVYILPGVVVIIWTLVSLRS